jgi:hypothetical protein
MDSLGDGGQKREHHEGIVERVEFGVRTCELRRSVGLNGTEHVVVGEEVVKAEVLDRCPDPPNSGRISSKLVLRVDHADLHGVDPPTSWTLSIRPEARIAGPPGRAPLGSEPTGNELH